jgi:MutS domain I
MRRFAWSAPRCAAFPLSLCALTPPAARNLSAARAQQPLASASNSSTYSAAPASTLSAATPSLQQYLAIKHDLAYRGAVVLFQLGGFLEAFYEDAALVASVCGIMLTAKSSGNIPMAGIPIDRMDNHVAKLLSSGYRVVLVEQEDGLMRSATRRGARSPPSGGAASAPGGILGRSVSRACSRPGRAPTFSRPRRRRAAPS